MSLRLSHPHAPVSDTLDLVMKGRQGQRLDFGADGIPPAPFALVVAATFDRGMSVQDWEGLLGPNADAAIKATLLQVWHDHVWPQFLRCYRIA